MVRAGWIKPTLTSISRPFVNTFTSILVQKRVHVYFKGDYVISALSSSSQPRFRNDDTDFLRSLVAHVWSAVKHPDFGPWNPQRLASHVKICSRCAVVTAAAHHSFRNSHRSVTQLKCCCEREPEDFWARSTHDDEAQHHRCEMSHVTRHRGKKTGYCTPLY